MVPDRAVFERSVREQIARNQARTPSERMLAFYGLLESVEAMMPRDPQAQDRRERLAQARQRDREKMRAHLQRLRATGFADAPRGL